MNFTIRDRTNLFTHETSVKLTSKLDIIVQFVKTLICVLIALRKMAILIRWRKFSLDLDDASSPADQKQTNPQEASKFSIQRSTQSLVHACQCRDANCRLPSCQRMKRVVQHSKICQRKVNWNCPICKQLVALCCYHAKHCQETKCLVPFCLNIKHKMKKQQLQQRLQEAHLLRRYPAQENMATAAVGPRPALHAGAANNIPGTAGVGAIRSQQQSPHVQRQVLQQLIQTLKNPDSPGQQQQILQILKSNPQLMAAFIKQRQQQQQTATAAGGNAGAVQQAQQPVVTGAGPQNAQGVGQQQIPQHILQQNRLQHMQMMSQQQVNQQQVNQAQVGQQQQPNASHQNNWYKHQILAMQRQQQQQQQQFPPGYQQAGQARLGGVRYQSFGDAQYSVGSKPVASPVMGPPMQQGSQAQMMRSPPPIRSPQPNPSPRPVPSPRPGPSPTTDIMHSHTSHHQSLAPSQQDPNDLTSQDQLSKFVEQL